MAGDGSRRDQLASTFIAIPLHYSATISTRPYRSPQRDDQAAATRTAILAAFADQLGRPGAVELSVAAAAVTAGVAVRTVHHHFPDLAARLTAVAAHADEELGPLPRIAGVADLPD
ncbi:MAG: hypothetical protein H0W25_12480, partial [Acidimicrobiia bacterium]|nr:hypothetical protein [Acidimicrobiia bacterium]